LPLVEIITATAPDVPPTGPICAEAVSATGRPFPQRFSARARALRTGAAYLSNSGRASLAPEIFFEQRPSDPQDGAGEGADDRRHDTRDLVQELLNRDIDRIAFVEQVLL
jgi:hypothetical protein